MSAKYIFRITFVLFLITAMHGWQALADKYNQIRMDRKVDRLCKIDGGIKVYETVVLPPEKFDEYGVPKISQDGKDEFGFGYSTRANQPSLMET